MRKEVKNWLDSEVSNLSVVTRYPGDFQMMLNDFSMGRVELILARTKEVFEWIKKSFIL